MGGIFSAPKTPDPPPPAPAPEPLPPAPEKSSAEVTAAAEAQRRKYFSGSGGRATTMLTGGLGVADGSTSSAVRLLGGVGRS